MEVIDLAWWKLGLAALLVLALAATTYLGGGWGGSPAACWRRPYERLSNWL